jgi:hypothetical protein
MKTVWVMSTSQKYSDISQQCPIYFPSFRTLQIWQCKGKVESGKQITLTEFETFEKCTVLFKVKEGENSNHRNTRSLSRIRI